MIEMIEAARQARLSASHIANCSTDVKNAVLADLADLIDANLDRIRIANQKDLDAASQTGVSGPKLKRLTLTDAGIAQMAGGLRQIVDLQDPVGQRTREYDVPSGLHVQKVRCPIGVIMMIYEARPNVTIDAFSLCFKAGNACILKGGREAGNTNVILARLASEALATRDLPEHALTLITTSDRESIKNLLTLDDCIDLVIPRGGTELIQFVHEHSRIPTVQHFHGVCHIFVDASADLDQALEICATAKTSAPATCNAVETILVHEQIAPTFVAQLGERFAGECVQVRGDTAVCKLTEHAVPATNDDWGREFLDLIVAVKVIPDIEAAINHIERFGSHHTDAILTTDEENACVFTARVQSSCALVNASTRFNDGFQLGLGAEIGISTSRVHAYGPMGLEELTVQRFVVRGQGQAR